MCRAAPAITSVQIMRTKTKRWKQICLLFFCALNTSIAEKSNGGMGQEGNKEISYPRMDYDQWKPLGRGDPLKNDPTFDYVPPNLDQVHYWMDPAERKSDTLSTSDNQKKEILLLGVTSKKPAVGTATADSRKDIYNPYMKYADNRIARPSHLLSMTSSIIPALFSFANNVLDRTVLSKETGLKAPSTVLMPPPMVSDSQQPFLSMTQEPLKFTTSAPSGFKLSSSTPEVTIQESNLIYQSSGLSNENEFKTKNYLSSAPSVNWELVSTTTEPSQFFNQNFSPPDYFMRTKFDTHNISNKLLEGSDSNHNINYVTPPPLPNLGKPVLFKGHVSDDNEISNSYVIIEKPKAQMHSTGMGLNDVRPMAMVPSDGMLAKPVGSSLDAITMQTIKDMETMQPPPITHSPVFTMSTHPIHNVLINEHVDTPNYIASGSSISNFVTTAPNSSSVPVSVTTTEEAATTSSSLTTDPLFKHYKQPLEPMKGPLYLIIQGHSKVKTYKPAKQINGIMIRESNEIPDNIDYSIKHLHGFKTGKVEEPLQRKARNGNLQTLKHIAQTGFGSINFEDNRRLDKDYQIVDVEASYGVQEAKGMTSEKYHKGIVEEARNLNP